MNFMDIKMYGTTIKNQMTLLIQSIQHLSVAKKTPLVYKISLHVSAFLTKLLTSQTTIEVQ